MDYERDEQTIFVKDLLFAVAYQWRKILIFSIILGLLGAGLSFLTASPQVDEESYQTALAQFNTELSNLKLRIEKLTAQKDYSQTYIEESPLMKLDPQNVSCAVAVLYVQTDYQIMPSMTYQNPDPISAILAAYTDQLASAEALELAASAAGTTLKYINEMVTVENRGSQSCSLQITVKGSSLETAEATAQALVTVAENASEQIGQIWGSHTLYQASLSAYVQADQTLLEKQQEQLKTISSLDTQIEKLEATRDGMVRPSEGGATVKSTLIFAILGVLLGAFGVAGIAACCHIGGNILYSVRTLKSRTGIAVLGAIPVTDRSCFLDRWLRKLEGRVTDPGHMTAVVANVKNRCTGSVLVVGPEPAHCSTIAQALKDAGVQAQAQGSLLTDAQTLSALPQYDDVLLVEVCGHSTYTGVAEAMERVANQKKQLLGCVLMDG